MHVQHLKRLAFRYPRENGRSNPETEELGWATHSIRVWGLVWRFWFIYVDALQCVARVSVHCELVTPRFHLMHTPATSKYHAGFLGFDAGSLTKEGVGICHGKPKTAFQSNRPDLPFWSLHLGFPLLVGVQEDHIWSRGQLVLDRPKHISARKLGFVFHIFRSPVDPLTWYLVKVDNQGLATLQRRTSWFRTIWVIGIHWKDNLVSGMEQIEYLSMFFTGLDSIFWAMYFSRRTPRGKTPHHQKPKSRTPLKLTTGNQQTTPPPPYPLPPPPPHPLPPPTPQNNLDDSRRPTPCCKPVRT